jgi:hypothetical protein
MPGRRHRADLKVRQFLGMISARPGIIGVSHMDRHSCIFYLLATLHGEPYSPDRLTSALYHWENPDHDMAEKNRRIWNRYMATYLSSNDRSRLLRCGDFSDEELRPLDPDEKAGIDKLIRARATEVAGSYWDEELGAGWDRIDVALQSDMENAISFRGCEFSDGIDFSGFVFPLPADFTSANFGSLALFRGAAFCADCYFDNATFRELGDFQDSVFFTKASFREAKFEAECLFRNVRFYQSSSFVNAKIQSSTSFEDAQFYKEPPRFAGASLHPSTIWRRVGWPPTPAEPQLAASFIEAYEPLKLEMDKLKKHEDELFFFAQEMMCRRVAEGWLGGLPIALYGYFCEYGRSYLRPLYGLMVVAVVGLIPVWMYFGLESELCALGLTMANTLGILGFRKEFIDPTFLANLPWYFKSLSALQTLAGAVLIFLFGLALRNRFRMK